VIWVTFWCRDDSLTYILGGDSSLAGSYSKNCQRIEGIISEVKFEGLSVGS
jgi:hypothetical protein